MKKRTLFTLAALFVSAVFVFAAGAPEDDGKIKVGISKFVAHPALDAIERGIQDGLAQAGYADVAYDLQNANGDSNTAASIANKFKASKVDLALGIATPTAIALANGIKDIPVLFVAVTEPISAGLVSSYDAGEGNVSGVSDLTPVREQIEMLARLTDLKVLGHVYCTSEANAVVMADIARETCKELGIEFVESTVSNTAEVRQATQVIINRVDGLYVSNDNTVVAGLAALADVALNAGVPVMSADTTSAETLPILAAWGFDYYSMGLEAGKMAAEVLGGRNPQEIPTLFMTDPSAIDLLINMDVAARLKINFPQDMIQNAGTIIQDGQLTKR